MPSFSKTRVDAFLSASVCAWTNRTSGWVNAC
jgi:hypothetical protein